MAKLAAGNNFDREIGERGVVAGGGEFRNERAVGGEDGAAEGIAEHFSREGLHHLSILGLQIGQEAVGADDQGLVGKLAGRVHGETVVIVRAGAADGVETLEREPQRIDAQVTIGAGGVAFVLGEFFPQRLAAEGLRVAGQRARVGRRRWRRGS